MRAIFNYLSFVAVVAADVVGEARAKRREPAAITKAPLKLIKGLHITFILFFLYGFSVSVCIVFPYVSYFA